MSPPSNGDGRGPGGSRRISHLTVINGGPHSQPPPSEAPASTQAESSPGSSDPLFDFSSGFDAQALQNELAKPQPYKDSPFHQLADKLPRLAAPLPNGGYDVTFRLANDYFYFHQEAPGDPIEFKVLQDTGTISATGGPGKRTLFEMTYTPDMKTSQLSEARASYNQNIQNYLTERVDKLIQAKETFSEIRAQLTALKGRPDPVNRAVWYDNFIVHKGKVYTLRIQNLGFHGLKDNPSLLQISVFEATETARREILTLSMTGEIQHDPTRSLRLLPDPKQLELLKALKDVLQVANWDRSVYQKKIERKMKALNRGRAEPIRVPLIAPAVETSSQAGATHGSLGEPIKTISDGRELLRLLHPFSPEGLPWENPAKPGEVRTLHPEGPIRQAMKNEFWLWFFDASWHGGVKDWRRIRPRSGELHLHLYPRGGGELTIYRGDDTIHNIIKVLEDGRVINLEEEIREMERTDGKFRELPHEEKLEAAANRINSNQLWFADNLQVHRVPPISINRIHLNPDGGPLSDVQGNEIQIRDAVTAWEAIQRLPQLQGLPARVNMEPQGDFLQRYVGSPQMGLIKVTIPGSQPPVRFQIRELDLPAGESGITKRVEVQLWRGEDHHVAVYDNGNLNPAEGRRHVQAEYNADMDGRLPVERWKLGLNLGIRWYNYARLNGASYGFGYLGTMPLIYGLELAWYHPGERKLLGITTPQEYFSDLSARFQKDPWGTVKKETVDVTKKGWHGWWGFLSMIAGAGSGSIGVDGFFNLRDGLAEALKSKRQSGASLSKVLRENPPRFFNADPRYRSMGANLWFRGFLKRGIPLLAGLAALEKYEYGEVNPERLFDSAIRIGAVATASAGIWRAVQSSESASSFLQSKGYILKPKTGLLNPRRAPLAFKGTLATVFLEFLALGIWATYDQKQALKKQGNQMRADLGLALDHHNGIMSRLEWGQEIPPQELFAAIEEVQGAHARYAKFLELLDPSSQDGRWKPLPLENEYGEEFERFALEQSLIANSSPDAERFALGTLQWSHQQRLRAMKQRNFHREQKLRKVYQRFGLEIPKTSPKAHSESLRGFLSKNFHPDNDSSFYASATPNATVQGDYSTLGSREDMAFLKALKVQGRPTSKISIRETTDTPTLSGMALEKFLELTEAVEKITREESAQNRFALQSIGSLAKNTKGLNAQMKDYYQRTNLRLAKALEAFLPQNGMAMQIPHNTRGL